MYKIKISSYTDIGDVKTTNQDCILSKNATINNHNVGLFIVADGCGGLAYGEEISNLVVTHFSRVWNNELKSILLNKKIRHKTIDDLLEKAIKEINDAAKNFGGQVGSKVGSTISLLLTIDKNYYIKNVGDSRVYLIRKNKITQLTEDQSLVADMIRNGELTKEEAKSFKKKNVLTMCIGVFDDIRTYSKTGKIKDNDVFLLCCDGLHNHVSGEEMVKIVREKKIPFDDKAKALREKIEEGKANDNVSGIICEYEREKHTIRNIILITLLIMLIGVSIWTAISWEHICEHWECFKSMYGNWCSICNKYIESVSVIEP